MASHVMKHGVSAYRQGCRCDLCRSAKAADYAKYRATENGKARRASADYVWKNTTASGMTRHDRELLRQLRPNLLNG